jgi:hypothetical protein
MELRVTAVLAGWVATRARLPNRAHRHDGYGQHQLHQVSISPGTYSAGYCQLAAE